MSQVLDLKEMMVYTLYCLYNLYFYYAPVFADLKFLDKLTELADDSLQPQSQNQF
jgi:hypothetical protein